MSESHKIQDDPSKETSGPCKGPEEEVTVQQAKPDG